MIDFTKIEFVKTTILPDDVFDKVTLIDYIRQYYPQDSDDQWPDVLHFDMPPEAKSRIVLKAEDFDWSQVEVTEKSLDKSSSEQGLFSLTATGSRKPTKAEKTKIFSVPMTTATSKEILEQCTTAEFLKLMPPHYAENITLKHGVKIGDLPPGWALGSLRDQLQEISPLIEGVTVSMFYLAVEGTMSSLHIEDFSLGSISINRQGSPKVWIIVAASHQQRLNDAIRKAFQDQCPTPLLHKRYVVTIDWLQEHNVPFKVAIQRPGDIIITFPGVYHQVVNTGPSIAEAVNVIVGQWLVEARRQKGCACQERVQQYAASDWDSLKMAVQSGVAEMINSRTNDKSEITVSQPVVGESASSESSVVEMIPTTNQTASNSIEHAVPQASSFMSHAQNPVTFSPSSMELDSESSVVEMIPTTSRNVRPTRHIIPGTASNFIEHASPQGSSSMNHAQNPVTLSHSSMELDSESSAVEMNPTTSQNARATRHILPGTISKSIEHAVTQNAWINGVNNASSSRSATKVHKRVARNRRTYQVSVESRNRSRSNYNAKNVKPTGVPTTVAAWFSARKRFHTRRVEAAQKKLNKINEKATKYRAEQQDEIVKNNQALEKLTRMQDLRNSLITCFGQEPVRNRENETYSHRQIVRDFFNNRRPIQKETFRMALEINRAKHMPDWDKLLNDQKSWDEYFGVDATNYIIPAVIYDDESNKETQRDNGHDSEEDEQNSQEDMSS